MHRLCIGPGLKSPSKETNETWTTEKIIPGSAPHPDFDFKSFQRHLKSDAMTINNFYVKMLSVHAFVDYFFAVVNNSVFVDFFYLPRC
jgi:hypothetical protein